MIPSFIGLAFGALWLTVGVTAAPSPWHLIASIAGAALFLGAAIRIVLRQSRGGRFDWRWYVAAVVAEVVAIGFAQRWLLLNHRDDLLPPVAGIIVGLHFLGLWRAMQMRRFVGLAAALVAINAAALLAPSQPDRLMLSGFGSAAALLVTAAA